jgi:dihydrolipoamide dehydrogenase
MSEITADVIVIGAGPGGYVAAIRAAQLGFNVIVIDKRAQAGGTCLNVGCIPSKALLHSSHKFAETRLHMKSHGILVENVRLDLKAMLARKDAIVDELTRGIGFLFRKHGIRFAHGEATLLGPKHVRVLNEEGKIHEYHAGHIILATGSESISLPNFEIDEKRILTSTGALSLPKVPKSLTVIGGGYIGLEMASVWSRLGSSVTVVEAGDRLVPTMDHEVGTALHKTLEKQDIAFRMNRQVTKVVKKEKSLTLYVAPTNQKTDKLPEIIESAAVLLAVGRRPNTQGLGLENVNIEMTAQGKVVVNRHYQTSCPGVYAIGDIIHGPMLAHKAMEEGVAVAEFISGQFSHVNYGIIPAVIYTLPEVASVGKTEEELKEKGIAYQVGKFPFSAVSRAKTMGETTGFVKILTDARTDEILGVHIIGNEAGSMIAEAAIAMEFGASAEDIARSCHAHPSFSEGMKEAAWAAFDKPIHM